MMKTIKKKTATARATASTVITATHQGGIDSDSEELVSLLEREPIYTVRNTNTCMQSLCHNYIIIICLLPIFCVSLTNEQSMAEKGTKEQHL